MANHHDARCAVLSQIHQTHKIGPHLEEAAFSLWTVQCDWNQDVGRPLANADFDHFDI